MDHQDNKQDQINMIMTLRSRGILDSEVLNAIELTPRHHFVSEAFRDYAYRDMALPIGEGQTIPEPYIVAKICEALWLREENRVLVIGTGSGYLAAVLAKIARRIYTVENQRSLMVAAEERFRDLELHNIATLVGNGWAGWLEQGPFDRIVIAAAVDDLPIGLYEQLRPEGIIVYPQTQEDGSQHLIVLRNYEDRPDIKSLGESHFSLLSKD